MGKTTGKFKCISLEEINENSWNDNFEIGEVYEAKSHRWSDDDDKVLCLIVGEYHYFVDFDCFKEVK